MVNDYYADIAIQILIYIGLGASLNLLMGYAGQFSMAQGVFYGIGAYTAGILVVKHGWNPFASMLAAAAVAFVFAGVVSLPAAKRVRGEYLILLTLAFQQVVNQLMDSLRDLTGGPYGFTVPWLHVFGRDLLLPTQYLPFMLAVTIAVLAITWGLGESPFGRLLKGIREDEPAVRALGKNTIFDKLLTFGITAALAGLIGGVSAFYFQFIAPGTYNLNLSIFIVSVIVLGGMGNLTGTIVGGIVLGGLRPLLQNLSFIGDENSFPWQGVIYGLALVLLMMLRPEGLLPEGIGIGSVVRRLRRASTRPLSTPVAALALQAAGGGAPSDGRGSGASRLEPPAAPTTHPNGTDTGGDAIVRITGLTKRFGGIAAVNGVDMVFRRHRITALIGPNGAGKTTIFNLITGALTPDQGQVLLHGGDITGKPPNEVATRGMARSFQNVRLFRQLTVLQNVALAVPGQPGENVATLALRPLHSRRGERETLGKALHHLATVGMAHKAHERAANLGYGEQKLVAIARLLATECEVLLLDEPTSGIDPSSLDDMIALVRRLRDLGRTICIVEHSLLVVERLADHVVFLEEGRVTAEGPIDELKHQERLVEVYFGT